MEGISRGLAVDLFASYRNQFRMERPTGSAGEVRIDLAAIVLDEGNWNPCLTSAFNEALQSFKDLRPFVHRHRRLKLIHLHVNNEQHPRQDSKG